MAERRNKEPERPRGLVAVHESRVRRATGAVTPIPVRFLGWLATIVAVAAIVLWKRAQGEVESWKHRISARQRGIAVELSPRIDPLLSSIEALTVSSAGAWLGDRVDDEAKTWDFGALPGIYLRIGVGDARDAKTLRKAAQESLHDGFTACLLHAPNPDPFVGPACKASRDCEPGKFCNETNHCTAPSQPYNLRVAYRGTRVLGDEWTVDLKTASDDMKLRLLERELDAAVQDDVPIVIDLLARAQYFMLVLDEAPSTPLPPDAGGLDAVQLVPHAARVVVARLAKGAPAREILRLRREVDAHLVPMGARAVEPRFVDAQQRQANSCQLALAVREAIGR